MIFFAGEIAGVELIHMGVFCSSLKIKINALSVVKKKTLKNSSGLKILFVRSEEPNRGLALEKLNTFFYIRM